MWQFTWTLTYENVYWPCQYCEEAVVLVGILAGLRF